MSTNATTTTHNDALMKTLDSLIDIYEKHLTYLLVSGGRTIEILFCETRLDGLEARRNDLLREMYGYP
jgi:hypothetical protein